MRGELFNEEPVQKVLKPLLHLFTNRTKYPRTFHFLWSPGLQNDDRMLPEGSTTAWEGTQVVITEKCDGEGSTFYCDGLHARSMEFEPHPSRTFIKAIHAQIAHDIPENFRMRRKSYRCSFTSVSKFAILFFSIQYLGRVDMFILE